MPTCSIISALKGEMPVTVNRNFYPSWDIVNEQQVMYAKLTENHSGTAVVKQAHDYFLTTLYDARRIYDLEQKSKSGNWVQKAINQIGIWSIRFSYVWHNS